jgi:hypothetical protein
MVTTTLKHMKEVGPPGYVCRICGLGPHGYLDALQHWRDTGHQIRRHDDIRFGDNVMLGYSTQSAPRYSEGTR